MFSFVSSPVNVELVKIRTIFELTGGRDSKEPANMKSMVRSSIVMELDQNRTWLLEAQQQTIGEYWESHA